MPDTGRPVVELICQIPWRVISAPRCSMQSYHCLTVISAPLAYNALLVFVCAYYAFKTRHLPDNFNEARFITFCVRTSSANSLIT